MKLPIEIYIDDEYKFLLVLGVLGSIIGIFVSVMIHLDSQAKLNFCQQMTTNTAKQSCMDRLR